ncbi:glycosyltransferase [Nitrosococcus oceani]|uniref:Glycosyl transferase, group 1 n=2 Tax=Nitrosococcus oceani TaxID=1229 RepID=Q3J8B4_NITOC|nr:glycosyltransferase [Nitrosococcus oceani]KFI18731.1 glycosyl transferase family 1 [Nitrosococcus oceani C-27]ABA58932.1 Glycosyl transferase, group 1 [Nitrosococcus oceani ATCC 19707]EDZ67912.1 glycosyl transferase, group 1 family protein [Nitrosococcus oceani AFC27]KFI21849.1 glycosyl transferase family 1 [Nitrosococcus oceani]GEM18972.1 glycosyl transferase family 1 [Nitrosococcus oceani]
MINVVHVITGLNVGGAERTLLRLLANRTASRFNPSVISLLDKGVIGPQIQSLGVPVYPLGMKRGIPGPRVLIDLRRLLKKLDPDVIQGWMYHGNLAATVAASSLGRRVPVLWNIRQSLYGLAKERWLTRQVIYGSAWLSRSPKIILYNSKTSASQHEAMGFKPQKTRIIPNGFDCNEYYPDKRMREQVRKELEIPLNTLLIGLIARYHPMKDHSNFLRAAAELMKAEEGMRIAFLLAGRGIDLPNGPLIELIGRLGLGSKVYLLGERQDISRLMMALDIATVASAWGEGFPNVLGEAMACSIPCVATDVGDSAYLIADTGKIVPPKNPQALAAAWQALIGVGVKGRKGLGEKARRRIAEHFNLSEIVHQYEQLYLEVTP